MEKTQPRVITVEGQDIPLFVSDINSQVGMAVVSLNVLEYLNLIKLLPKAHLGDIMHQMRLKMQKVQNMEQYCQLLKNELEFHQSVNLIKEYFPAPVKQDKPRLAAVEEDDDEDKIQIP